MRILSSTFEIGNTQIDGRRSIEERHRTDDGREFRVYYYAEDFTDLFRALADNARALETNITLQDMTELEQGALFTIESKVWRYLGTVDPVNLTVLAELRPEDQARLELLISGKTVDGNNATDSGVNPADADALSEPDSLDPKAAGHLDDAVSDPR